MGDQQNLLQQSDTELSVLVAEMPLAAGAHQLALLFFDNHDRSHALRVATASAWQRRVACAAMQNHKSIAPQISPVLELANAHVAVPMYLRPFQWGSSACAAARMCALRKRRKAWREHLRHPIMRTHHGEGDGRQSHLYKNCFCKSPPAQPHVPLHRVLIICTEIILPITASAAARARRAASSAWRFPPARAGRSARAKP